MSIRSAAPDQARDGNVGLSCRGKIAGARVSIRRAVIIGCRPFQSVCESSHLMGHSLGAVRFCASERAPSGKG